MLFKKYHAESGKTLKTSKPLLLDASSGYIRPPETGSEWFMTTTSVWPCDELIGRRIRDWRRLTGENGHEGTRSGTFRADHNSVFTGTHSVFPVPLAEWIILRYAGPVSGLIIDSFAGGPPRALVSSAMGYQYVGFEIRQEQIDENISVLTRLGFQNNVRYINSSGIDLFGVDPSSCDFALTCPPYHDLEKYSELPEDISNLSTYEEFNQAMFNCAEAHKRVMKPGAFVCIVTSCFRNKKTGELRDFPGDTINNFRDAGFLLWQKIILSRNFASAAVRSTNAWAGKKLVPRHEELLVFRQPEVKNAKAKGIRQKA